MRTIYILWIRQLKRYIRKKATIIGSLGQPIIFLFVLGFGLSPIYAKAGGGDYIQFIAPGIIGMTVLFTSMFSGVEIIWDKQFGFLKETFVAPVSRLEIFIGKTLGGATVAIIQGCLVFLITLGAGFRPENLALIPVAFLFLVLISFLFSAFGNAVAARLDDMQGFPLIINFVIQPLFFLSGAIFPLKDLPVVLDFITKINPLSYGIDALRFALSANNIFPIWTSLGVLVGVSVVLVFVGVYQFSKVEL